jgi:hypothetical protein
MTANETEFSVLALAVAGTRERPGYNIWRVAILTMS